MTPSDEAIVAVADVFVSFQSATGGVMALRGADLTVASGERLVVQGPNGSGKTTLLRVITGEQQVVAGSVRVGGTALDQLGPAQRRRWRAQHVGFVDQHARRSLLAERSVLDNVALQLRLTGSFAQLARHRARRALDDLALGDLAERPIGELSGGEAQQVAICAAIAHGPRLVLADEPTGELGHQAALAVYAMLSRIAADGTSVILVSHDPRSHQFADRSVRIRDGRVAEQWWPGDERVAQVPDSRGWIRLPPELLPPKLMTTGQLTSGLVATSSADGVLFQPRLSDGHEDQSVAVETAPAQAADREPPSHDGLVATPLVELSGVAGGFPGRPLFESLDLALRAGDWFVVTGESGSGKSTLLSVVAGLLEATAGTLRVGGTAWAGLRRDQRAELRRHWLALAPQRSSLVEALTVAENLRLTAAVRGAAGSQADVARAADRLGLSALLDQPVDRLSGGERQRVALARCLIADVSLLVLDEPTSQQDEVSAARVIDVLRQETASGRAILVASHDPRLTRHATGHLHLGPLDTVT